MYFFSICTKASRIEATEHQSRKRRVLPMDYSETKRRKTTPRNTVRPYLEVEVKIERMELLQRSLNELNKRVGSEIISDDQDTDIGISGE